MRERHLLHVQENRSCQILAASVLENPEVKLETNTDESSVESSRQESHLHASSSNGSGIYEGSGSAAEPAAFSEPIDGFTLEINACDDIDDILEIVGDEADMMSGSSLAAALKRYLPSFHRLFFLGSILAD